MITAETGELVSELERFYRIDDRVMKYMTVLLEKEADIEAIKAEMAKAEAPEESDASSPEASEASAKSDDADETTVRRRRYRNP